jgi:hypothetical protein
LNLSTTQLVRENADLLTNLPSPDEWWYSDDVQLPQSKFQEFYSTGLIEHYGDTRVSSENSSDPEHRWRWIVNAVAYERAQKVVETRDSLLPCGHAGLCNTADGYECAFQYCDRVFDREEVRQ